MSGATEEAIVAAAIAGIPECGQLRDKLVELARAAFRQGVLAGRVQAEVPAEAALPDLFELQRDGTHTPVIPREWLTWQAKAVLRAVLHCADLDMAIDVAGGALHAGTVLAVLHGIADKARGLDAQLAEDLIPRRTEEAAKR